MSARGTKSAGRGPRTCCVCGAQCGTEGPWPHGWDAALAADEAGELAMLLTCSQVCRQTRGWPERQMGLIFQGDDK